LNEPSIQAVGLTKRFGSFTALDSLNLNVEGSKCVGFLGPNGAGKTTTLKLFTDLIRPSSGEALVNGVNVHTRKKKALESVGTLIETPEIYPSLTQRPGGYPPQSGKRESRMSSPRFGWMSGSTRGWESSRRE